MKVCVVVENTSTCVMPVEHGLSLWIEACGRKFLFDLGQGGLFAENAVRMGIDVGKAEFAIVSHGHYDHGGGIATFLRVNQHAPVYLRECAFTDCYSLKEGRARYIGLEKSLQGNDRIRLVKDDVTQLSDGLTLFPGCTGREYFSPANHRILKKINGELVPDDFSHEQSLIIEEGERCVLIAGCAHSGILNIMSKAESILKRPLTDVISGLHLTGVDDPAFIDGLAQNLLRHTCLYHTCHCTGEDAFRRLKEKMRENISYISCGEQIHL